MAAAAERFADRLGLRVGEVMEFDNGCYAELVDAEADAFPGYYTLHTLRDGQVTGMLSVRCGPGEVWYHSWHGRFIRTR